MAITPGVHSFTLQRRADHDLNLTFKDGNNNPINLTGYTVESQVWDVNRTTKYADWTVTYTNRAAGEVKLTLTDTQTATFTPADLRYDVLVTNGAGLKEYWLEGNIFVDEGYTA